MAQWSWRKRLLIFGGGGLLLLFVLDGARFSLRFHKLSCLNHNALSALQGCQSL